MITFRDSLLNCGNLVFLFGCLVGLSTLFSCGKPELLTDRQSKDLPEKKKEILTLPIERVLKDTGGRELDAIIVQRSATHITIIRHSDKKTFDLAIARLSELDRSFVERIPVSLKTSKGKSYPFAEDRKKEIEVLEEKIRDYHNQLNSGSLNGSQTSAIMGELKRLNAKANRLRDQAAQSKK